MASSKDARIASVILPVLIVETVVMLWLLIRGVRNTNGLTRHVDANALM